MEIVLGLLLGLLIGGALTYLWMKKSSLGKSSDLIPYASKDLLLKLIQSLPDIVIWVDRENKIKYASDVALSLNIARDEKIQIPELENLISAAREIDDPIVKKVKAKKLCPVLK